MDAEVGGRVPIPMGMHNPNLQVKTKVQVNQVFKHFFIKHKLKKSMKYKLRVFLHLKPPPTFLGLYAPEALLSFSNKPTK